MKGPVPPPEGTHSQELLGAKFTLLWGPKCPASIAGKSKAMQPIHMSFLIRAIISAQRNDTLQSLLMAQANLPHLALRLHPSLLVQSAQAENCFWGAGGRPPNTPGLRPRLLPRVA